MAWPLKSVLLLVMCLVWHDTVANGKSVFRGNQFQVGQNVSSKNDVTVESDEKDYIRFGIILPKTSLITLLRQYYKKINDSLDAMTKGNWILGLLWGIGQDNNYFYFKIINGFKLCLPLYLW